jgi:DNA (cytosine-5)-methyltransferase 1
MNTHRFPYKWTLKDAFFTKDKGRVFSCFACGGGSTMGYKLAGFDVIGHNDIDKKMVEVYKENHNPKFSFLESITTFAKRKDLPKELYNLDILDGSPPCSSFSMAGNREKDWGKEKVFREGQELQVLDTLFFDFIDLAKELQPKIVIAENVKGLLLGNAKEYVRQIYKAFDLAGYYCQHWLLDASKMGVPQKRERVFFIAMRKDIAKPFLYQKDMFTIAPKLNFDFKEPDINFCEYTINENDRTFSDNCIRLWQGKKDGDKGFHEASARLDNKPNNWFSYNYVKNNQVMPTILANDWTVLWDYPRHPNKVEYCLAGSYPLDYNFLKNKVHYLIGMSVPPVMTAQIATEIYNQWLSKL